MAATGLGRGHLWRWVGDGEEEELMRRLRWRDGYAAERRGVPRRSGGGGGFGEESPSQAGHCTGQGAREENGLAVAS